MIIQSTESVGKSKYVITNDQGAYLCLYYREMKAYGFEAEAEVDEATWAKARKDVVTRGKKRLFHLLSKKDYAEKELREKLEKTYYDEPIIDDVLAYFKDLGYVDDVRFVQKMYNYYKGTKSLKWIENKLYMKGIDRHLMKEALEEVRGEEDLLAAAKKAAAKKIRGKSLTNEEKQKVIQSLMRKGFDYGTSKSAVEGIINEVLQEDL